MCEKCKGVGFFVLDVPTNDHRYGRAIPCGCKNEERNASRQRRLEALDGLTAGERKHTFANTSPHPDQRQALVTLSLARVGTIVLKGNPGAGKSHMLHCVVNDARAQGRTAVYCTMTDLLDYLRSAFNPKNEEGSFRERWDLLCACDVLCIDELDEFAATDWATERFLRLIDERWRHREEKLTVVALNSAPEGLLPKVASRLMNGTVIRLETDDMRQAFKETVPA